AKVRLATRVPPAVELKPGAAPGIENGDETRKRFAGWKSRAYFREPAPTKLLRGSPHEEGRAIVKRGDLEVARLAPRVAKHGKRDKSVGRRLEHGLDEAELQFAFLHINQQQRRPPTVGEGQGDKVVSADRAVDDSVRGCLHRLALVHGPAKKVLQRARPVH